MPIKVITYEESRLEFFKKELKMAKNKFDIIGRKRYSNPKERKILLLSVGEEVKYYEDIVKMLDNEEKYRRLYGRSYNESSID